MIKPFCILFIYLFILIQGHFFIVFRERGREGEKNIDVRGKHYLVAFLYVPDWGSNLQPAYGP